MKSIEKRVKEYIETTEENLIPGSSGSKHAGWKGRTTTHFGKDREGRPCALVNIYGWHGYSRSTFCVLDKTAMILYDTTKREVFDKRVPASCESIEAGLAWMEGAVVRKAREAGKKVLRQGDVYFIPQRIMNFSALVGSRHEIEEIEGGVIIHHPEHKDLKLNSGKRYKAVLQKNLQTRFGGGVGAGD